MGLKWIDTQEIAIQLNEKYPEVAPQYVKFTDLYKWVIELEDFEDDPKHCGEKVLESIQQFWLEEKN